MNLVANACALKAVYVVKRHWGELILAGAKTVEISHRDCKKRKGQIIGIAFSGSNFIRGEFKVWNTEVLSPLTNSEPTVHPVRGWRVRVVGYTSG